MVPPKVPQPTTPSPAPVLRTVSTRSTGAARETATAGPERETRSAGEPSLPCVAGASSRLVGLFGSWPPSVNGHADALSALPGDSARRRSGVELPADRRAGRAAARPDRDDRRGERSGTRPAGRPQIVQQPNRQAGTPRSPSPRSRQRGVRVTCVTLQVTWSPRGSMPSAVVVSDWPGSRGLVASPWSPKLTRTGVTNAMSSW